MAYIQMRKNKDGSRVFRLRVESNGTEFQTTWPAKDETPIPETWSDKRARTEAGKAAARFEDEVRRGLISNDKRTLAAYCKYVLDMKGQMEALKPSTIDGYLGILRRIQADRVGSIKVRDLSTRDLNSFYLSLAQPGANLHTGGPLSAKSIRECHAFISSVLHQAAKEGILALNPATNATLPKVIHREANFFDPARMAKIIEAIQQEPTFWQAMTYLFIGTGARRGELMALTWPDVDFEHNCVHIHQSIVLAQGRLVVGSTKTGRGRVVSVAPAFMEPLKRWKHEQAQLFGVVRLSGYVFSLTSLEAPVTPDAVTRYYARLSEKYGLDFHINPHAFRHSQASVILADGDIVSASRRLGHAQTSTTLNIYGHMMPQTDIEAAARVADAFLSVPKTGL